MGKKLGVKNRQLSCPKCDFTCAASDYFGRHLKTEHNETIQTLWDECNNGPVECCCGCGEQTTFMGWIDGYKPSLVGHWGRGLTKATDARIAKAAKTHKQSFIDGKITAWPTGLTNENSPIMAAKSKNVSTGLKLAYAEDRVKSWSKGKTMADNDSLKQTSDSLKLSYALGNRSAWASGQTLETNDSIASSATKIRLKSDELVTRIEDNGNVQIIDGLETYSTNHSLLKYKCLLCNETFDAKANIFLYRQRLFCPHCHPAAGSSYLEREMADFIKSLPDVGEVITNTRNVIGPKELDVWLPSHNVAVEFNGKYWHSDQMQPDRKYHSRKSNHCMMRGIRLLHVFENEWRDQRDIVESMIKARLGIDMQRIDARKCIIKVVSPKHRRQFFNNNHIDGDVKATVAYGLYYNNSGTEELVYCMSLRRPFHKQYAGLLDIVRCASRTHTFVRGGLGRLTKVCMRHAKDMQLDGLMTYVDQRFGGSNAYQSAGWQFLKKTNEPRYWWFDDNNKYNSSVITARRATEIGLRRFWGCRQAIYVMR